jgi:hypothetical protein
VRRTGIGPEQIQMTLGFKGSSRIACGTVWWTRLVSCVRRKETRNFGIKNFEK